MSIRRFAFYFALIALLLPMAGVSPVRVFAESPVTKKPVVKMSAMQQELKRGQRRIVPLPGPRVMPLPGFHFPRGKKGR